MSNVLLNYLPDFVAELEKQLGSDYDRWGDTWRSREIGNQTERIYNKFRDYKDQHDHALKPIPWLKIAGLALIAWTRENKTGWQKEDTDV